MGMVRPVIKAPDGMERLVGAGDGVLEFTDPQASALVTVGAGVLTSTLVGTGFIYRTGPTGAYTDTIDTVANLDAGLGAQMNPGDCLGVNYSNQVAFVATIAGGTGITLSSTKATIPASGFGQLILKKIANAVVSNGYNSAGSPTVTVTTPGVYQLYVL